MNHTLAIQSTHATATIMLCQSSRYTYHIGTQQRQKCQGKVFQIKYYDITSSLSIRVKDSFDSSPG